MKLRSLFLIPALAASPAFAQTTLQTTPQTAPKTVQTTMPPAKRATIPALKTAACAKLPELSVKIPALPAGLPCARPLYTITTVPTAKLEYVSPLEGPGLRENLGLEPTSFSLDFIDTRIGTGELAAPHKWYTIHYTGYLIDGTKFDSSVDRGEPISIPYGQHKVIPGWDTGFDGMHVGGKRRLFIPYQLAYGPTGRPPVIPEKAMLVFDVELLGMSDTQPPPPSQPAAAQPAAPPAQPAAARPSAPAQSVAPARPAMRTPDGTIPAPATQTPPPAAANPAAR